MIEALNVSKSFNDIKAVDDITATIKDGTVFGLIGTNGAGKSTFLRMASGVLKPDKGEILIDKIPVFENEQAKEKIFYISDEQHFLPSSTGNDMKRFYKKFYRRFDEKRFDDFMDKFELDRNRKISTFSKGMKKQVSVICGVCANTEYLFCDETFDGLDPVVRQAVKSIFAGEIEERNLTPVVASHNLRELEDICDHVGLLHRGGILLSKDLEEMKFNIHKIQCVFNNEKDEEVLYGKIDIINREKRGSLVTITARGTQVEIVDAIKEFNPVFYEVLPLSLEEIFISETEVVGYDIKKLIF